MAKLSSTAKANANQPNLGSNADRGFISRLLSHLDPDPDMGGNKCGPTCKHLSTDINWWTLRGPFCKIVVETFIYEGRTRAAGILYVYFDVKIIRSHLRD
jgi:hypothetical protein